MLDCCHEANTTQCSLPAIYSRFFFPDALEFVNKLQCTFFAAKNYDEKTKKMKKQNKKECCFQLVLM